MVRRIFGMLTGVVLVVSLYAAGARPASAALLGDVDGNCVVNSNDLGIAAHSWGYRWGSLRYNPRADLNNDRVINVIDLQIIASRMGTHC